MDTSIPMFTRMGSRVEKILYYDKDTHVIRFQSEDGAERAYHLSELVHHNGAAGVAAHIVAAGFKLSRQFNYLGV